VTGASVYVLSEARGHERVGPLVAERENAADLMGGVSFGRQGQHAGVCAARLVTVGEHQCQHDGCATSADGASITSAKFAVAGFSRRGCGVKFTDIPSGCSVERVYLEPQRRVALRNPSSR